MIRHGAATAYEAARALTWTRRERHFDDLDPFNQMMAVLETAAHIDDSGLPLNRYLVEIDVPDAVWARREALEVAKLHPTWAAIPAGRASVKIGSDWLTSVRSAILMVPSVIVPEELAALVNPKHPDAAAITAKAVRAFEYDRLLRS